MSNFIEFIIVFKEAGLLRAAAKPALRAPRRGPAAPLPPCAAATRSAVPMSELKTCEYQGTSTPLTIHDCMQGAVRSIRYQ